MALFLRHQAFTGNAHAIGNKKLVGLLELDGEQTIESVLETYFALAASISHAGGRAARIS
jgi:hypothetical protein